MILFLKIKDWLYIISFSNSLHKNREFLHMNWLAEKDNEGEKAIVMN